MRPSREPRPERIHLRPPDAGVLRLPNRIAPGDIPALCRDLRGLLLRDRPQMVLCDAAAVIHPDVAAIDALARLQLTAHRLGSEISLTGVSNELRELVSLAGLDCVLPTRLESTVHPVRQPEEREVPGGVQEETDPTEPALGDL